MFLEVEEGGQDPDEEAVKVYLIRFIADLPLSWYTGSVFKYTQVWCLFIDQLYNAAKFFSVFQSGYHL